MQFGGNTFLTSSIPLACGGRYFIIEPHPSGISQVSVLCADNVTAFIEVLRNKPCDNSLTTGTVSPPGIVTSSDKSSGDFLYKIRPASETSVTFGKIKGNGVEAAITDTAIVVYRVEEGGSKTKQDGDAPEQHVLRSHDCFAH